MRKDSLFKAYPYEVVRMIVMDNDGVWSLFCELWNEIRDDLGIHCLYVPKDNDKDAAMAAGACPGFRFFVCGVLGNFRRTRLVLSRSIHLRFCSGHAPPSARPKYRSSPLSHLGRSPPAARPAGRLVPGPVFKYLLD